MNGPTNRPAEYKIADLLGTYLQVSAQYARPAYALRCVASALDCVSRAPQAPRTASASPAGPPVRAAWPHRLNHA